MQLGENYQRKPGQQREERDFDQEHADSGPDKYQGDDGDDAGQRCVFRRDLDADTQ